MNKIFRKKSCSHGSKAVRLLESRGILFEDITFNSKEEEEAFKSEHDVSATPQIFLEGVRIGGYDQLVEHFGEVIVSKPKNLRPVIAVFVTALLLAIASGSWLSGFMGISVAILACLKLMNPEAFENGFKQYDLVSSMIPQFPRVYPYLELFVGLGFIAGFLPQFVGVLALAIGGTGAYSVYKAVYVDKRDLNCACVGGGYDVPLGVVSLAENVFMLLMGLWLVVFG